MRPHDGEEYDDFLERCTGEGHSEGQCDRWWEEGKAPGAKGPCYRRVLSAFYSTPLALLPEKLEEVRAFLRLKAAGGDVPADQVRAVVATRRDDGTQLVGKVALLPVFGVLAQRVGMMEAMSGGVGTEAIGNRLDKLVADREVRSIVMVFDSPGGSVYGVEELGAKVRGYRADKKIVAIADSLAASAAYWLASQASEVNVTPGGQVGSIGVLAAHQDVSKKEELEGIKTTIVSAGKYKAELADVAPLGEEARAELQGKVDHYYGLFVSAVARGRGVSETKVRSDFGQGRTVTAKDAVARGMADHVATLEQVLRRLGAYAGGGPSAEGDGPALDARLAAYRARAVEVDER